MEVLRIDHIHYKTDDTDKVVPIFTKLLGAEPIMDADFAEEHGVHDTIWGLPNAVQVCFCQSRFVAKISEKV